MALDLNDKTPNGNNLTNVNTATDVTTSMPFATDIHAAALAAASTQYLYAADSTSLSVTGNMTSQAYVKFTSLPSNGNGMVVVSKYRAGQLSWLFWLFNNVGTYELRLNVSNDGTAITTSTVTWTPSTGTWYHLAVAYDTGGNVKFYVDSVQQGATQTGAKTSIFDSNARLAVGAYDTENTPSGLLDGQIDEVRVYNTNRTQGQISGDYQQLLTTPTESALQAYWPFEAISASGGNYLGKYIGA